ncbi:MAG: TonB-dependent receptor [Flavobacterium sp.]|nr:TonB-dependent receptor [Flavobacterium sp.]
MKIKFQYILIIALTATFQLSAQKKDENIGTEVVNVVKAYTPTISDAFKVKETPGLEDEDNTKREPIQYSIFSFPVASTFSPSKGKAANVDKTEQERLFKNYATLGVGSYANILGELYVTENIGDTDFIAGNIKHLSSFSDVKESELPSKFLNSSIGLTYGSKKEKYAWTGDLGYQIQKYFWYGLPDDFGDGLTAENRASVIDRIDQGQTYNNFNLGGRISFNESIFNGLNVKYNRFWDAYGSTENHFLVSPTLGFEMLRKDIKTTVTVDHVSGSFNDTFDFKYGYTNLGVHPSFGMRKDEWSFEIGAQVVLGMDTQNSNNELFFYPKANASLKVVGDFMIFFLGIDGELQQNSYREFTNENPFLSPTLVIAPTDKQFDVYAGLKGKLANSVSYTVRGSVINEKNKAFFVANNYDDTILVQEMYQYGNSFGLTYDKLRTFRLFGELRADFSKNVSVGVNGTFNTYSQEDLPEAWNLPQFQLGANIDANITAKWYAGANLFFVGDRKDYQSNLSIINIVPRDDTRTVKSYFDANAHLGYKYNQRFTAFLRLNNIGNQAYEKWLNYPVQSFQVLLGANYKFDF